MALHGQSPPNPSRSAGSFRLKVRATPNAKRSEVTAYRDGVLFVKLAAPPRDGKANAELLKMIKAHTGSTPKLVHGESSRDKLLEFADVPESAVLPQLIPNPSGEKHG